MADVVIQNPVINSPFTEPVRHFEFGDPAALVVS